jgi:hypothetical protein
MLELRHPIALTGRLLVVSFTLSCLSLAIYYLLFYFLSKVCTGNSHLLLEPAIGRGPAVFETALNARRESNCLA